MKRFLNMRFFLREIPVSKILTSILLAGSAFAAHAEGGPAFLTKEQATEAVGGKAFTFARATDGAKIRWDFKSDGTVYANNRSSTRKDAGEWTVRDDGDVCIRWRGGSNDSCNSYFMKDGQLQRSGNRSSDSVAKALVMSLD